MRYVKSTGSIWCSWIRIGRILTPSYVIFISERIGRRGEGAGGGWRQDDDGEKAHQSLVLAYTVSLGSGYRLAALDAGSRRRTAGAYSPRREC